MYAKHFNTIMYLFPIVVTNGGIQINDFDDADYIFSNNAAAKDTLRYL